MKREEKDFLGLKKRSEGKSYDQSTQEIRDLIEYQKEIKDTKKLLIQKDKIIDKLTKELDKVKKNAVSENLIVKEEKGNKSVTLGDLNKILALLADTELPRGEVKALCLLTDAKIDCAVSFLKRHKLITERVSAGMKFYIANE